MIVHTFRPYTRSPWLVSLGRGLGLHSTQRLIRIRPVEVPIVRDFRADVARYGPGPILEVCELVGEPEIDEGHPARLQRALWRPPAANYGPDLVLDCFNGTPDPTTGLYERVLLRVPDTCRTPHEAASWTYGVDADAYHLARRT